MRAALAALLLVPAALAGQEPIFVTPPVTMYQFGVVVGIDVQRQGRTVQVASEVAFGMLPPWTVSVHAVGIDAAGAAPEFARAHLGTRIRLLKVDRPREWILLSLYGAGALPAGDEADLVARRHGVPDAIVGLSATRMARGGDAFFDVSVMRTPTPSGTLTGGVLGLAAGWRPKPGGYGDLEAQLFAEARGQYLEGGSAVIGLASGVLLHSRNAVLKTGVLIPAWTRRTAKEATLRVGIKLLL